MCFSEDMPVVFEEFEVVYKEDWGTVWALQAVLNDYLQSQSNELKHKLFVNRKSYLGISYPKLRLISRRY